MRFSHSLSLLSRSARFVFVFLFSANFLICVRGPFVLRPFSSNTHPVVMSRLLCKMDAPSPSPSLLVSAALPFVRSRGNCSALALLFLFSAPQSRFYAPVLSLFHADFVYFKASFPPCCCELSRELMPRCPPKEFCKCERSASVTAPTKGTGVVPASRRWLVCKYSGHSSKCA